ncbi:glycoside hydrolase family 3 C-terminal domain-containing protein [bacterium]|nr:glycoside hydrolase family 3 C-terminal domain-containing protein [bacterium]
MKILSAILFFILIFLTPTLYANMKAKASSLQSSAFSPYFAIDGNPETRWSSGFNDDQWLIIDLEKQKNISSMHITWEHAMAEEYKVLVSNDEKNWKTVFNKTSKMKNERNQNIEISPTVKARYIKIDCKKRTTQYGFSIYEIKVNGKFLYAEYINNFPFKKLPAEKPYANKNLPPEKRAELLLKEMSLDEKGLMAAGFRGFYIPYIERLGMRPFYMTDASQGVRLQSNTPTGLRKTTAFPCTLALASTWNPELSYEYAKAIGEECSAGDIAVLLGPGMNIYRISECGRNFEYMGEDPWLASRMIEKYVKGVQSCGVMTTLKHFVANNTDFHRRRSDSIVKERELHEIYLPAFKAGVDAGAAAVMTSYNLVNGEWAGQSKYVITDLLRGELGFKGLVMTDWTSVYNQKKILDSGLDLIMPGWNNLQVEVEKGNVSEKKLDKMVLDTLTACFKMGLYDKNNQNKSLLNKFPEHEKIALKTAHEGIVLLRNENNFLPLQKKKIKNILLIGEAAQHIAYGGGSGVVKGYDNITLLDAMKNEFGDKLSYKKTASDKEIKNADAVVVAMSSHHGEGHDTDFECDKQHAKIAKKIAKLNPNNVVVTMFGSGQRMVHWADKVTSLLYAWYGGQCQGKAIVDILVGRANPSGKLPITIEKEFADSPGANYKPKDFERLGKDGQYKHTYKLKYNEGVLVGYRWYDTKNIEPLYPFGFGLSYTTFKYDDLKLSSKNMSKKKSITVSFTLKNTGKRASAEIAQLYVHDVKSSVNRPVKELKGFKKVFLKPGETKKVALKVNWKDLAFWNPKTKSWTAEDGKFKIMIGSSSRDIKLESTIDYKVM